ncbi:MAG: ABC transporter ATP-binding protein [Aliidongia sp.]
MTAPVLGIEDLSVSYTTPHGPLQAVSGVDLSVGPGEIVGIIGESGCGKSTLVAAIMGMLPGSARIGSGAIRFGGRDLVGLPREEMRKLRGGGLALVSQNPMTAFNPVHTIGRQLTDFQHREGVSNAVKRARITDMFDQVGITDPSRRLHAYPHEFSGGMLQRMAIAAALLTRPQLIIADEPTTALDVTLEAQIIALLRRTRDEQGCSILFVSHHLGAVAQLCDRVLVMYAGVVVEAAPVAELFRHPAHPYTQRLLACDPALDAGGDQPLPTIAGQVPNLVNPPEGCRFAPRCLCATGRCVRERPQPVELAPAHAAACHLVAP